MSRPNRCIKDENGNEVWISRSSVVIPIVFKLEQKTGDVYALVEQRGPVVSHANEWCCPCGFIDWDETLEEACIREVREETGLDLADENILFFTVDTNPKSTNQTIDHIYMCWIDDKDFDLSKVETRDEVLDVRWLKVAHVYRGGFLKRKININIYKKSIQDCYGTWAFKTHPTRIIEMLKTTIRGGKIKELDE